MYKCIKKLNSAPKLCLNFISKYIFLIALFQIWFYILIFVFKGIFLRIHVYFLNTDSRDVCISRNLRTALKLTYFNLRFFQLVGQFLNVFGLFYTWKVSSLLGLFWRKKTRGRTGWYANHRLTRCPTEKI